MPRKRLTIGFHVPRPRGEGSCERGRSVRLICWVRKNTFPLFNGHHNWFILTTGKHPSLFSTLLRTFSVEVWVQESHKFGTAVFCPRLRGPERGELFGYGNNRNCYKLDTRHPRLQNQTPLGQNLKSSQVAFSPFPVVRTEISGIFCISMNGQGNAKDSERSVSVSSDRNIREHL